MSWDIDYVKKESYEEYLKNPEDTKLELIEVAPYKAEGGTHRAELANGHLVAATVTECETNITYNYSPFYYEHIDKEVGLRWINGKTGAEVKERLEKAIEKLGIETYKGPNWVVSTHFTFGQLFPNKKPIPSFITEEKYKEYLGTKDWDNHPDKQKLVDAGFLTDGGSYWKATPGNAGNALMRLLVWVIQNPNGVFIVS
jgi:hypothetical protein